MIPKITQDELKLYDVLSTPLQKKSGFHIVINRYFTDVNGTILVKTDPAIPLALQTKYPFWMFGEFDRLGGYRIGNERTPPMVGVHYVMSFVVGSDIPFLFATGLNNVKNSFNLGDVVHVFTDDLDAPSVYCWIQQSSSSAALASIYANAIASEKEKINIEGVNYIPYTNGQINLQLIQNLNATRIDVLGSYNSEPIDPLGSVQTFDKQDFIFFPIKFKVDQYNLISTYIDFTVDSIEFAFLIKKNTDKV